jgi:hypothetical protein
MSALSASAEDPARQRYRRFVPKPDLRPVLKGGLAKASLAPGRYCEIMKALGRGTFIVFLVSGTEASVAGLTQSASPIRYSCIRF